MRNEKKRRQTFLMGFFIFFSFFSSAGASTALQAQTADKLEELLNAQKITYAWAVSFTLEAAEITVPPDHQSAFSYAKARLWLPSNAEANDEARLNGICYLMMQAFDLKGGFFYTLFENPHYAYRELVWKGVIPDGSDPSDTLSGEQFLYILGKILSFQEAQS
jgi:hypothetical protein